jgi:hypothetical protein
MSVLAVASASAFGQGKVAFANDSLHLVYYGEFLPPADTALVGQGVSRKGLRL